MSQEVLRIRSIDVKDCFLHFSPTMFRKILGPLVYAIKLSCGNRDLFFSFHPSPSRVLGDLEIGLNATYVKYLNLEDNECLLLIPITNIGSITKIHVRPATEEDLEILHTNKGVIETSFLNQLRIVWTGQVFPLWVTPSVSVKLVVGTLVPDLAYGRLEEYSEIFIEDVSPEPPDYIKSEDGLYPSTSTENMYFRCLPLECQFKNIAEFDSSRYFHHPYDVFVNKSNCCSNILSRIESGNSLWSLHKPHVSVKSKGEKEGENSEKKKEEVVVSLHLMDDSNGVDIGKHLSLYIHPLLRNHTDLKCGNKVILKHVGDTKKKCIAGLIASTYKEQTPEERENIKSCLNKALLDTAVNSKNILLNNKAPFPLNSEEIVILTLRPLDLDWGLLTLKDLRNFSISVSTIKLEGSVLEPKNAFSKSKISNYIPSFEAIISEGFIAADFSLHLSSGFLKKNPMQSFIDNVLIVGKAGSGKTMLLDLILSKIEQSPYFIHVAKIDCRNVKGKRIEGLNKIFLDELKLCEQLEPSVLALENLTAVTGSIKPEQEYSDNAFHYKRVITKMLEMIEFFQVRHSIMVFGTADSIDVLNPKLFSARGKSLFTTVLNIPPLTQDDRCSLVENLIRDKVPNSETYISELKLDHFASLIDSYVPRDILSFVSKALFEAWQRTIEDHSSLKITNDDMKIAYDTSTPLALHGLKLFEGKKKNFSNVGGLTKAKEILTQMILWPTKYSDIMNQCPLKQQNAVLLYGFPGTGKTLLASAVAGESKLNFIAVKGPELMSKYIGESEESVRKLFERAQAAKPCLLFFDEFDSLAPRRGLDRSGVSDRVVNQLLTALDGVEPLTGIWVVAATSRPDLIDPALLRPGRIGTSVFCNLPDQKERLEILNILCSSMKLSEDVNLTEIAEKTNDFSGADLKGLITSAQIKVLDNLDEYAENFPSSIQKSFILEQEVLLDALKDTEPSLQKEKSRYEAIYQNFLSGNRPDMTTQKVTFA